MKTLEKSIDRLVIKGEITKVKADSIKATKRFKDYKAYHAHGKIEKVK